MITEYNLDGGVIGDNNSIVLKNKIPTEKIKDAGDYTLRFILSYDDQDGNRKNIKKDAILQIKGEI